MNYESMKENSKEINEFKDFEKQKIYSYKAIWGFSVVFSPIFGGVLLMQNLKDSNKEKEGKLVLLYSLFLTLFTFAVVTFSNLQISNLAFFCNMIGGCILSYYFQKKYFPDEDKFGKKKIWKALIISILITLPFVLALIYSINNQF